MLCLQRLRRPGMDGLRVARRYWRKRMTAGPSFGEYRADLNLRAARVTAVLAAILVPSGVVLDWFTHRDQALFLLSLRMIVAVVALACLWLTFVPSTRRYEYLLGLIPVLATAVVIEIMVLKLEGYSSPYYAGLAHCLLALGVIFYWSVPESLWPVDSCSPFGWSRPYSTIAT